MANDLYVIILDDGHESFAVPAGEGNATREETLERVAFWNGIEGFTATLGKVFPEKNDP